MGLSIFYSGTLRDVLQLPILIDELTDICDDLHWPWQFFDPSPKYPLNGIMFNPPGAQSIPMTFLKDGRIAEPYNLYNHRKSRFEIPGAHEDILLNPIIQYAGPDAHMRLMGIMRHLSKNYFKKFRLVDESEFWETGNEQKCRDWFVMFAAWMDNMSEDLGKLDGRGHEGGESYHARLWELLRSGTSPMKILDALGDPYRNTWKDGKWINGYGIR